MKYLCCVWLFVICLVIYAQQFAMGLHIQRAPEIVERITRQATRYIGGVVGGGGGGGVGAQNYRPSQHLATAANYNKRTLPSNFGGAAINLSAGQRTKGVGAYSFGGMASGRPSYGNTFAINTAAVGPGGGGGGGNAVSVGSIKSTNGLHSQLFNQQLQQHLLKAQQYQQQQNRPQQQQVYRQPYNGNY
uniref:Attacin C-terminal domain-containing protein n=1 Tax=Glossina austeni TaxID=7395 RepID=A0A1A9VI94_GLOAU